MVPSRRFPARKLIYGDKRVSPVSYSLDDRRKRLNRRLHADMKQDDRPRVNLPNDLSRKFRRRILRSVVSGVHRPEDRDEVPFRREFQDVLIVLPSGRAAIRRIRSRNRVNRLLAHVPFDMRIFRRQFCEIRMVLRMIRHEMPFCHRSPYEVRRARRVAADDKKRTSHIVTLQDVENPVRKPRRRSVIECQGHDLAPSVSDFLPSTSFPASILSGRKEEKEHKCKHNPYGKRQNLFHRM